MGVSWARLSNYRDPVAGGYKNDGSNYRMAASDAWTRAWAPRLLHARFPEGVEDVSGALRRGDDYRVTENGVVERLEWKTWLAGFSVNRGRPEAGWEFGYGDDQILLKIQAMGEEMERPRFLVKAWTAASPPADMTDVFADRPQRAFLADLRQLDFFNKATPVPPKHMNNRRGGNPATLEMRASIYHPAISDLRPPAPPAAAAAGPPRPPRPKQGGLFT